MLHLLGFRRPRGGALRRWRRDLDLKVLAGDEAWRNLHSHRPRGRLHLKEVVAGREPRRHLHHHELVTGRDHRRVGRRHRSAGMCVRDDVKLREGLSSCELRSLRFLQHLSRRVSLRALHNIEVVR